MGAGATGCPERNRLMILVEIGQASQTTSGQNGREGSRLNLVLNGDGESDGLNWLRAGSGAW